MMQQLRMTRGGLLAAGCWLAIAFGKAFGDCVDDGVCALYKGYHYKTLDGTLRDESSIGCQSSYLAVPDGWEVVGYTTDGRYVASAYRWGTERILHDGPSCYMCSSGTKLGSASYYHDWRTSSSGGKTTYAAGNCNARILVRQQGEATCPRGEEVVRIGNSVLLTCSACQAEHVSDGGLNAVCRPKLAYAAQQVINSPPTEITAEPDINGIVRMSFWATALPVVYEPFVLEYDIDMQPNESSLDLEGASNCQQKHWSSNTIGNETYFTAVFTYSDLNKDCLLDLEIESKEVVKREGVIGVALNVMDENGTYQGTVQTWQFPVDVHLPANTESIYSKALIVAGNPNVHGPEVYNATWAASTLTLYEPDFHTPKWLPMYKAGERCYLVQTLIDSAGLTLTPVRAWISKTREASGEMLHNLTDSIVLLGYGIAGTSQARLSVVLQDCVNCFLHVEAVISRSRRLENEEDVTIIELRHLEVFTLHGTSQSVSITVEARPSETEEMPTDSSVADDDGSEEHSIAQLALLVGGFALLLIACGLCVFIMRLKAQLGEIKYKPAAMDDPEAMTT